MSWGRLCDTFYRHPKVRRCSMAARGLWVTAFSWLCDHTSYDGFIPESELPRLVDYEAWEPLVEELLKISHPYAVGLWTRCDGGYLMHDYLRFNLSSKQLLKVRKHGKLRVSAFRERNGVTQKKKRVTLGMGMGMGMGPGIDLPNTVRKTEGRILLEVWNEHRGKLPAARGLSSQREAKAKARMADRPDVTEWVGIVQRIASSAFCNGGGSQGWVATFDWLLKPETALRVVEGAYDDRAVVGTQHPRDVTRGNMDAARRILRDLGQGEKRDETPLAIEGAK